jgi:hypothetical protein
MQAVFRFNPAEVWQGQDNRATPPLPPSNAPVPFREDMEY